MCTQVFSQTSKLKMHKQTGKAEVKKKPLINTKHYNCTLDIHSTKALHIFLSAKPLKKQPALPRGKTTLIPPVFRSGFSPNLSPGSYFDHPYRKSAQVPFIPIDAFKTRLPIVHYILKPLTLCTVCSAGERPFIEPSIHPKYTVYKPCVRRRSLAVPPVKITPKVWPIVARLEVLLAFQLD